MLEDSNLLYLLSSYLDPASVKEGSRSLPKPARSPHHGGGEQAGEAEKHLHQFEVGWRRVYNSPQVGQSEHLLGDLIGQHEQHFDIRVKLSIRKYLESG